MQPARIIIPSLCDCKENVASIVNFPYQIWYASFLQEFFVEILGDTVLPFRLRRYALRCYPHSFRSWRLRSPPQLNRWNNEATSANRLPRKARAGRHFIKSRHDFIGKKVYVGNHKKIFSRWSEKDPSDTVHTWRVRRYCNVNDHRSPPGYRSP